MTVKRERVSTWASITSRITTQESDMTISKRGIDLLRDPSLNESTAFTDAEKQELGIVGLVPDVTESEDQQ